MVMQVEAGRNQWRNKGRLRFPVNGLVLYAPLWNSQLSGSPFNAWNIASGGVYSCTVTGTTQGITGRDFDGVDDKIVTPDTASLDITGNLSFVFWAKIDTYPADTSYRILIDKAGTVGDTITNYACGCYDDDGRMGFYLPLTGGWVYTTVAQATFTLGGFGCYGFIWDGTNRVFYKNGVAAATIADSGTIGTNNQQVAIGALNDGTLRWDGIIGDVYVYNRALSAGEIWNNYLMTKWRYQ